MKRLLASAAVFVLSAGSALGGMSYDFRSVTSGKNPVTLAGSALIEGNNTRIDFESGDNIIFKSNAMLLSTDGGKSYLVFDRDEKTYYEFALDELLKTAGAVLKSVGGMVQMSLQDQKVDVRDAGAGEPIEGYPTKKSVVTSSYELSMKIMGMSTTSRVHSVAETWYTDKIPADFMTIVQKKGLKTGFEELDKLIESQTAGAKGFPLRQVMTVKSSSGKQTDTAVTTTTISNIKTEPIPAKTFAIPEGYVKKNSPSLGFPPSKTRSNDAFL